jgi:hypothetical protein
MAVGAAAMLAMQRKLAGTGSTTYWLTNRPDDARLHRRPADQRGVLTVQPFWNWR